MKPSQDSKMRASALVAIAGVGLLYWLGLSVLAHHPEPWDAPSFWTTWYPVSLLMGCVLGVVPAHRGWLAGPVFQASLLPVLVATSGVGPLLGLGVLLVMIMAVPAALLSGITSSLAVDRSFSSRPPRVRRGDRE